MQGLRGPTCKPWKVRRWEDASQDDLLYRCMRLMRKTTEKCSWWREGITNPCRKGSRWPV